MKRSKDPSAAKKPCTTRKPTQVRPGTVQNVTGERPRLNDELLQHKHQTQEGDLSEHQLSKADILQLQRTHGNSYMQWLLAGRRGQNGRHPLKALQRQVATDDSHEAVAGRQLPQAAVNGARIVSDPKDQQSPPKSQASQSGTAVPSDDQKPPHPALISQGHNQPGAENPGKNGSESTAKPGGSSAPAEAKQKEQKAKTPENGVPTKKKSRVPVGSSGLHQKNQEPGLQPSTEPSPASQSETPSSQPQSPQSAHADPDFQATVAQIAQVAGQQKLHPPATAKAQEAQDAAQAPSSEVEARAQANQAKEIESAETPPFDATGFKAKLMQRLQALTPRTAEQAEQFKASNKVAGLKAELKGKVQQESKKSKEPMEKKASQAPDTGAVPAKMVAPLQSFQSGPKPIIQGVQQAVPKPKKPAEIEAPVEQRTQSLDDQMKAADITEEQLKASNEPEFQLALAAKQEVKEQAKNAPPAYRQEEQEKISQAQSEVSGEAEGGLQQMQEQRDQGMGQVGGKQAQAKSADEAKRASIAAHIQGIFSRTKSSVEGILGELEGQVAQDFEAAADLAQRSFVDFVDSQMKAYKATRYSGPLGLLKWAKDKLLGMPPEVNAFFQQGRELYIQQMDGVIDSVVAIIGEKLQQAKVEIANGRAEIDAYIAQLPAELQQVGRQAAEEIELSFQQLENQISTTQSNLVENLAQIYTSHLQEIDNKVSEIQSENKGLVQKAADAIGNFIKTITSLKDKLVSVLEKVVTAVKQIMKDPVGFLNDLVNGISHGFSKFFDNIAGHLKDGLLPWLAKALAATGIDMPDSFDLKGIFSMVTQVLGFTWSKIRDRATALLGENVVGRLEQNFEIFVNLKNEGFAGIWNFIKENAGALQELLVEPINEFLLDEVIKNGIEKVTRLLAGPAGAFVDAVQGVHKVISWFINNGRNVASLVSAIIGAIENIAGGVVSQAAELIESSLAKSVPKAINFFAQILGLSDIGEKIRAIIQKIRDPVEKVIDWVIKKRPVWPRKLAVGWQEMRKQNLLASKHYKTGPSEVKKRSFFLEFRDETAFPAYLLP